MFAALAQGEVLRMWMEISPIIIGTRWFNWHRTERCIFCRGDSTLDELRFMGFEAQAIDLVYNGIPSVQISYAEKLQSRTRLRDYAQNLLGYEPDVVMTHVTRPVISKGLWRDLLVLTHLDKLLEDKGQTGVFFVLTTAAEQRSSQDVERMESEYGWPVEHRIGLPDLVSNEVEIWQDMEAFNRKSVAIQAVLVNQFGWESSELREAHAARYGICRFAPGHRCRVCGIDL